MFYIYFFFLKIIKKIYYNLQAIFLLLTGWIHNTKILQIENKLYIKHQRLNVKIPLNDKFCKWLVGFTDGDGSFTLTGANNAKWCLIFKLGQSSYNLRLLCFILSKLSIGSISINPKDNNGEFRITDRKTIGSLVIPIFDKYPLLTSKFFNYSKFRKPYFIMISDQLSSSQKNKLLLSIKTMELTQNYISPAWSILNNNIKNIDDAKLVMDKFWLIGFTEAEGSFYIVKKSKTRLVNAFEVNQKLDIIVLQAIALILGLKFTNKKTYNTIVTTNSKAIANTIVFYKNTMFGMKSVEFKIWSNSFYFIKEIMNI